MAPGCHAAVLLRLLLPLVLQWRAAAWREYKRCAGRELLRAGEEGAVQGWASSRGDAKAPLRCGSQKGGAVVGLAPRGKYFWRSQGSVCCRGKRERRQC